MRLTLELLGAFILGLYFGGYSVYRAWIKYHNKAMNEAHDFCEAEINVAYQSGQHQALEDRDAVWKAFHELFGL